MPATWVQWATLTVPYLGIVAVSTWAWRHRSR